MPPACLLQLGCVVRASLVKAGWSPSTRRLGEQAEPLDIPKQPSCELGLHMVGATTGDTFSFAPCVLGVEGFDSPVQDLG